MRDHSNHVEVSRDQAVRLLLDSESFTRRSERIPLREAMGRVASCDVRSLVNLPNSRSCKMDSVAVRWADFADGSPDTSTWRRGTQWEFANTGIAMPDGFDTAIVIENVRLSDDLSKIEFVSLPSEQYAGTSEIDSKLKEGELLVSKGQLLSPLLCSYLAMGNHDEVDVVCRPRVAVIPTGNELFPAGGQLPIGKNIESNSYLIAGKIEGWGGESVVWDIVRDDKESIKRAVVDAASRCDFVVLNAGSSKGSDDWNVEMLEEVGRVLYHQTSHGPGHHSWGALVGSTPIVGISGPPGGAAFTADFYIYPLIRKYLGLPTQPRFQAARLAEPFPARRGSAKRAHKREKASGEDRPSVVAPGSEFFGVRQVRLGVGDDGVLEAYPAPSSHLNPAEADSMDGYFLMSNLMPEPEVGDIVTIEIRPKAI